MSGIECSPSERRAALRLCRPRGPPAGSRGPQSRSGGHRRRRDDAGHGRRANRPPLLAILRDARLAPLVLMTAAAMVPGTLGYGINLVGVNLERSFHLSNAGLGAVAFVAQAAQLLWAVPLALWADRGSRKLVAIISLLIFAVFGPAHGPFPERVGFVFLYLVASIGFGVNNTVHNSYLADAYPTEGRGRIFSWHNLSDPSLGHGRPADLRAGGIAHPQLALWPAARSRRLPDGSLLMTRLREPEKGANESQPHPQVVGHGPALPAGEGPPGAAGLGRDPAPAHPVALLRAGGRGHPRLRRHRGAPLRQSLLPRQVPPGHRRPQRSRDHRRAWRVFSASRWPT